MTDEEKRRKNREYMRKWRAMNPEKSKALTRKSVGKWREANPERAREVAKKARAKKKAEDPEAVRARNREKMRKWREANPERDRANSERWREANPERVKDAQKRYRENHPEKADAWREANPDLYRVRNRGYAKKWAKNNPEKVMENQKRRRSDRQKVAYDQIRNAKNRAAKRGLTFDDSVFDIVDCLPERCAACAATFELKSNTYNRNLRAFTVDRVDNSKGYVPENLGYLCFRCNALKSDATLDELKAIVAYMERHFAKAHR